MYVLEVMYVCKMYAKRSEEKSHSAEKNQSIKHQGS